jgi:retinol-binding protein 3
MTRALGLFVLIGGLLIPARAPAQILLRADQPDSTVEQKAIESLIKEIVTSLEQAYVFPETAKKMASDLQARLEKKEYEKVTSAKELAKLLSDQLQAISKDKHLRVIYSYDAMPMTPKRGEKEPEPSERNEMREKMRSRSAAINYGFLKVERLEGNIGYLELSNFHPAELGGETAAAAMNFLANTDALIIDLRQNGGGAPSMVALLCSYLFSADPVHLNDLYFRPDDSTHQWWTLPYVPGKRYEGKPVYLLTSARTFSAAEEFTYNLKSLKRAAIVGETTGGGAHPGGMQRLDDHFGMFVPSVRAINPITKTNWEGTGVAPDVSVPAAQALKTAHVAALKKISADLADHGKSSEGSLDARRIEQIQKTIDKLEKELAEAKVERNGEAKSATPPKS